MTSQSADQLAEAVEQSRQGQGASALVSAENGIVAHLSRFADDEPFTVEMAQALSRHAQVLHRFGDPDLAVAAADLAIRTFLNRQDEMARTPGGPESLVRAGLIAADIHQRFGRPDIAASAKKFSTQAASATAALDPPVPLLADMSLARALDRVPPSGDGPAPAVLGQLKSSVTAPATDCSLIYTSQRCTDDDAPTVAGIFAGCAAATMAGDAAAGLRLGLEAHVLYAHQSELQTPELRYNMGKHGPAWAQTLVLCGQTADRNGLPELAVDLASWMAGVINALVPFAFVDPAARSVMRTCLTWHIEILNKTGDAEGAAGATQMLQTLETMT